MQGPALLSTELFIPASSTGNNDLHIVAYMPDLYKKEGADALKIYRKLNIENTATKTVFNYRYWLVDDKEIAAKLQIDTTKPGQVYLIREAQTAFNNKEGNVNIHGFDFSSERLLTREQISEKEDECRISLAKITLNAPIVVKDANVFRELCMMFKTDTLLVYANPDVHGQE